MTLHVASIDPSGFILVEFRIYIEQAEESKDVRPGERVVLYARGNGSYRLPVDKLPDSTTAYDRCDDREYPGDLTQEQLKHVRWHVQHPLLGTTGCVA